VERLFTNRYEQIVVEYQGKATNFVEGEEAMAYALSCHIAGGAG
jgi:hypothetical protein